LRPYLAELDAGTGRAAAWRPHPALRKPVELFAAAGSTVYAAGAVRGIGIDEAFFDLAVIDATSGRGRVWPIRIADDICESQELGVDTLVGSATAVYVSGCFDRIGGKSRYGIAAINPRTGAVTLWEPRASFTQAVGTNPAEPVAVAGGAVYLTGPFDRIGGAKRRYAAAVSAATGKVLPWNPRPDSYVWDVAIVRETVYLAGAFERMGGVPRGGLGAVDVRHGALRRWRSERPNGLARVLSAAGRSLYVGGEFGSFDGVIRRGLAGIDARTGVVTAWHPRLESRDRRSGSVSDLAVQGRTLYVAGEFQAVDGERRSNLAAFDTVTGRLLDWSATVAGQLGGVRELAVVGDVLYAVGYFDEVNGQKRAGFAALDARSGELTSMDIKLGSGLLTAIAASSTGVFIYPLGSGQLIALEPGTGAIRWRVSVDGLVSALIVADDIVYVGGSFKHVRGQRAEGFVALDAATGQIGKKLPICCEVYDLALAGRVLYVAQPGTVAAVDLNRRATLPWRIPFTGGEPARPAALATHGSSLYVGGLFTAAAGEPQPYFAAFP
jgi:outer membrane protein assembly factor BamB